MAEIGHHSDRSSDHGSSSEHEMEQGSVKHKRARESDSGNEIYSETNKKRQLSTKKCYIFISSKDINITKVNPIRLQKELTDIAGPVERIQLIPNSIKITCNATQAGQFKRTKKLLQYNIKVDMKEIPGETVKGIIHGVHIEIQDDDFFINQDSQTYKIVKVERLTRLDKTSLNRTPLNSVILHFKGTVLPQKVFVGFLSYNVKQFIPRPLRCYKCQRFGHTALICKSQVRCPTCGGPHEFKDCNATVRKCCHCAGDHSAAYKGCTKYNEAQKVQEVKTIDKISYSEAVKRIKQTQNAPPKTQPATPKQIQIINEVTQSSPETIPQLQKTEDKEPQSKIPNKEKTFVVTYAQITSLIVRIMSEARNPTFWTMPRENRMKIATARASQIFNLEIPLDSVLKAYENGLHELKDI